MLKYFKEHFTEYDFAAILQVSSLILFVIAFGALLYGVWKRPKDYYDETAHLPLDDDEEK